MGRCDPFWAVAVLAAGFLASCATRPDGTGLVFRAGAFASDVTPTNFPVAVNGGFLATQHGERPLSPFLRGAQTDCYVMPPLPDELRRDKGADT